MSAPQQHRSITQLIQQHWNSRAADFDDELEHGVHSDAQRQAWFDLLARVAGSPPRRVLDVGCGTGVLAILLAQLGHTVTGIDIAPQMLARARQKANDAGVVVEFRAENAVALSDPDGTYDLLIARHVVWTLPDPVRAILEWVRALRTDGRLAIIEGRWWSEGPEVDGAPQPHPFVRIARAARHLASYGTQPGRWRRVLRRLRTGRSNGITQEEARYQEAHVRLPFYGGPTPERLADLLKAAGLRHVAIEPLMAPVLWGRTPPHLRYLAVGTRSTPAGDGRDRDAHE